MELSELESFHFLYRSLWNQNTDERVTRQKMNMMDTIIFLQGFPVRWLFTSEKTGEVLRKKDMTPKDIITSLRSRSTKLKVAAASNTKPLKGKNRIFAVIWYKNEAGVMAQYKINEFQLFHMLKERLFTQAMVAVQVFFEPMPFKGSGIFEHHYNAQTLLNVGAHKTYELAETPSYPDFFDMHERIVEQGTYEEFAQSQSQSHMAARPELKEKPVARELISVSETQHDLIIVSVVKLIKLMEALIRGNVLRATFVFYFNDNWSPFVVATKNVIVQPTVATARILMYTGNDHAETMLDNALPSPVGSPFTTMKKQAPGKQRKVVKDFKSLKFLSKGMNADDRKSNINHAGSDSDSDHSSDYFSDDDKRNVAFQSPLPTFAKKARAPLGRKNSTHHAYAKLKSDDPRFIPPPQPGMPESSTQYSKGECTPERLPKRRTGIGARSTALQKILNDVNRNETKVQFADTSEPVRRGAPVVHAGEVKSYMMNTEVTNIKVQAYKEEVCGKDPTDMCNRRPISAPHNSRRHSALLQHDPFAETDCREGRFVPSSTVKSQHASSLRKKLNLQKDTCFGDYCGILCKFLEEWEIDESLIKVKDKQTGIEKFKSTKIRHQIPTKSIFLCRSEVAYSGFDIALQENLACLGHDREDILSSCARNHIENVSDKCRKEALLPILTMAQLKTTRTIPSLKEAMIMSFVYRNMVYNDALSKVHPARFYYTAPVCDVCNDMYTALDEMRTTIIYKKQRPPPAALKEADTQSLTLGGDSDDSRSFEDRIMRARENLKKQAEKNRAERLEQGRHEEKEGSDDGTKSRKSLDSSKIPWESTFMFEMNALQQGSVVMGALSAEESVFLEDTDAVAEELLKQDEQQHQKDQPQPQPERATADHQNHHRPMSKNASSRTALKESLPATDVVKEKVQLKDYQKSMTALLNPYLGKTEEVKPEDVQKGMLKSKSQGMVKTASATIAANTFSSWANLLDTANCKGRWRRPHKGFKLRQSYKNNPEVERKRKEVMDNRRLDRQHEVWTNGLHKPNIELGAYTQTNVSRAKTTKRRPHSAGATRRRKSPTRVQRNTGLPHQVQTQCFNSPPKGKHFELETEEDLQEFNDIKGGILGSRGLHSVAVKHSTKVLCGGDFTHVVMGHPEEEQYVSPQRVRREGTKRSGNQQNEEYCDQEASAYTGSVNLLDTGSSSVYISNHPLPDLQPPSVIQHSEVFESPVSTAADVSNTLAPKPTPELQGARLFVSSLLKNSPMSPQNINYNSLQNTAISNAVKTMIDDMKE
mmetsp:Transcript_20737/g.34907  ORF Transcript_20737/g.34907 Transcript_20737/m.34907 type:complete len:1275 (-) Transcript_20737:194-4018(-)